ncbi:MAG: DUF1653 domain-containing protein [bacterium]|nr:DUF1653 domain-containing protein [bacterium]
MIKTGLYIHTKSRKKYRVMGIAKHSETLEDFVVYEAQYDNELSKLWIRPVKMFDEEIEINSKMIKRFEYIGE